MSDLKINLSNFSERFSDISRELSISEKVNFIFGKNGTGKSTITNAIKNQFMDTYDVYIFDGYEGIVGDNHRLDAVALGVENSEIQVKIDKITEEINLIKVETEKPIDNRANLFTKLEKAQSEVNKKERNMEEFLTNSARAIKNKKYDNINIAVTSYNKENFRSEIPKAKTISDQEILRLKEILKSNEKRINAPLQFPDINTGKLLNNTNLVLQTSVSQKEIIDEITNNEKQNFAKEGLRVHEHKENERCAFCGNIITEERWIILGRYFNDEVKKLESKIDSTIADIDTEMASISSVKLIDDKLFDQQFVEQVCNLNLQLETIVSGLRYYFNSLKTSLEKKKKNLFSKSSEISISTPVNFKFMKNDYESLVNVNNTFADNLKAEQETARNTLRYNEIKNHLEKFHYIEQNNEYNNLRKAQEIAANELQIKIQLLKDKEIAKTELILQTKDEERIAKLINTRLLNMGVTSFSLELINNDIENQKGQYQIRGYNNVIRPIFNLSKGEKNIIAFLYFMLSLDKVDNSIGSKIIVLDDPMTSNDDTMQYLMIGEIQKYYRAISDGDYFFVFTHNCHFYLNVRPNIATKYKIKENEISHYEKYGNYHLFTNGKLTSIKKILKGKNDFTTNYEMLWRELVFLFSANEPNLMLNACRKICETYMHFTKKGVDIFYGNNISAKKLFDVNQHSVDDLEAEQNGKTKDEIKIILEGLFQQNNAKEHFDSYFRA